jgi:ubiquinone/menaquinone biosynthesis C-methylase UbiE
LQQAGVHNAEVVLACAEAIPYAAGTFDVVLSNGVLNLSPLKIQSLREIARVLKPGGRLQCADIVLQDALPAEVAGNLDAWSD